MDFQLNDVQQMLSDSVGDFVRKQSPVERARKLRDSKIGFDRKVWSQMAELGWIAAPLPEDVGGFGGNFVEAAAILEQLGKGLVPEPYTEAVLAGYALARAGTAEQREQWLAPLLSGEKLLVLAWAERDGRYGIASPNLTAIRTPDGYSLSGEKVWVPFGAAADGFVVSARTDQGATLFVLPADADGLTVQPMRSIDGRGVARLEMTAVAAAESARLGKDGDSRQLLKWLFDVGAAAAVAEGVGLTQTILNMTVEYLGTREQFGKPIGAFQALQHKAVDMFVEVQLLKSVSIASTVRVDDAEDDDDRRRWVSAAKVQLGRGGRYVAQEAIQLHGGVGITDEHDIGLFFKRLEALTQQWGGVQMHTERFARLLPQP